MYDIEIKIRPQKHLIAPALETVSEYAKSFFDNDKRLTRICLGLEEAISNVISYGYSKHLDYISIGVEAADGAFAVSIIDKGLPGDYDKTLKGIDRLGLEIMRNVVDEVTITNMGMEGRCQKLVSYYAKQPVFEEVQEEELEIIENPEFTFRSPKKDEMLAISRGIYNEYGMTYPKDLVYYPERFYAAVEADTFHSSVAVDQYGNVAGHHAAFEWDIVPGVYESGLAIVSKRYRHAGLLKKFMKRTTEYVVNEKEAKIFVGGCVTTHEFSQKSRISMGSLPCAFKLNQAPPDMVQSSFKKEGVFTHEAFAGSVYDFNEKTVYIPDEIRPAVEKIYESMKLPRTIINEGDPSATTTTTDSIVLFNKRLRSGEINLLTYGADYKEKFHDAVIDLKSQAAESISIYLSSESPVFTEAYEVAKEEGFFFTGIFPNTDQGDVVMMQNILANIVDYSQIVTISPFTELLEFIKALDPDQNVAK